MNRTQVTSAMLLALGPAAAAAQTQGGSCPKAPPAVRQVAASQMYGDAAHSVVDKAGAHQNYEQTLPVRKFVAQLSKLADSDTPGDWRCGKAMLVDWAGAGALLDSPANFSGQNERRRFALAISVAAIKLMRKGGSLPPPVVAWIGQVNDRVMADFRPRNVADNLNAWSGANAQLAALITHDATASAYADTVWAASIAQIADDGTLPTELKRAQRALHYHEYYADALFMLRAARQAAGKPPTAAEDAKLRELAGRIDSELCAAPGFRQKTGVAQERPTATNAPVALAFGAGFPVQRWKSCAAGAASFDDPTFGGDLRKAAAAIRGGRR